MAFAERPGPGHEADVEVSERVGDDRCTTGVVVFLVDGRRAA
jgi:hypothetical protein